jgi:four helix bundle protein
MTMNLGQKEDFTRMALWQQAQDLAAQVAALVSRLPRDRTAEIIGGQLMRSAGSVPANIAEGYGRYSQPAYRNHLSIARGSVFESISWLDLLCRCGHISQDEKSRLVTYCQTVGKLLTLRMKSSSDSKLSYARDEGPIYEVDLQVDE